jgi:hypothetical protein
LAQFVGTKALQGGDCPQSSITFVYGTNNQDINAIFSAYGIEIGGNREKHCELALTIEFPLGCTSFELKTINRGSAYAQTGVTGNFRAYYDLARGNPANLQLADTLFSSPAFDSAQSFQVIHCPPSVLRLQSLTERNVTYDFRTRITLQLTKACASGDLTVFASSFILAGVKQC